MSNITYPAIVTETPNGRSFPRSVWTVYSEQDLLSRVREAYVRSEGGLDIETVDQALEYMDEAHAQTTRIVTREEYETDEMAEWCASIVERADALGWTLPGASTGERTTIALINPWSGALVEHDISDLTQQQLDAYPLDEDVCNELAREIAPCTPAEFLAAYVARVGSAEAGRVIIGS